MPNPTDAIAGSSTAKTEDISQSAEGKKPQKSSEQLLAEYKAENERKQGVIDGLKESLDGVNSQIADLRQLVESGQATRQQENQLEKLNLQQGNIDMQLAQLENDPKNQLGYLSIDRRIEKAVKVAEARGEQQALYKLQVGLIEDAAEDLGVNADKFTKELIPLALRFQFDVNGQPINVYRKAQLAIREWKRQDAQRKADAEAKKKDAEANATRETGTREARESSQLDQRDRKPYPGNFGDDMKKLGL